MKRIAIVADARVLIPLHLSEIIQFVTFDRTAIIFESLEVFETAGGAAIDVATDGTGTVQKLGTADVTMTGVAPLPQPGTISAVAV